LTEWGAFRSNRKFPEGRIRWSGSRVAPEKAGIACGASVCAILIGPGLTAVLLRKESSILLSLEVTWLRWHILRRSRVSTFAQTLPSDAPTDLRMVGLPGVEVSGRDTSWVAPIPEGRQARKIAEA
jgi:hypothetical protein